MRIYVWVYHSVCSCLRTMSRYGSPQGGQTVFARMKPSWSTLSPDLPQNPMMRYPSGNVSKRYVPPPPPKKGDFKPVFVTKVIESSLTSLLYQTCTMYCPSGTVHSANAPPNPPCAGVQIFLTPSPSKICMLSIIEACLMMNLAAFRVVDGCENSKGDPPSPPQDFDRASTEVAAGGCGLSDVGFLQPDLSQYAFKARWNWLVAALMLKSLFLIWGKRSESSMTLYLMGIGLSMT